MDRKNGSFTYYPYKYLIENGKIDRMRVLRLLDVWKGVAKPEKSSSEYQMLTAKKSTFATVKTKIQ